MTYNVEKYSSNEDERNHQAAVDTILTQSPDIVGVQEDNEDWYKKESILWAEDAYLADLAESGYTRVSTTLIDSGLESLAIFYKTDKFEEITAAGSGTISYATLGDRYTDVTPIGNMAEDTHGRSLSYVVLRDKKTGIEFLVVNTHLHYGSTATADVEHNYRRIYQASLLIKWLDDMANDYPNQIVMGDFNADPNYSGKAVIDVLTDDLELAKDNALLKGDVGGSCVKSGYAERDKDYLFDHIFYRNMKAIEYSVINNKVGEVGGELRYPSDHLPVYSEFICYK